MIRYRLFEEIAPRGPWTSLRVAVEGRAYWLSWNGTRLARSSDLERLVDRFPTLAEELVSYLEAGPRAAEPPISTLDVTRARVSRARA